MFCKVLSIVLCVFSSPSLAGETANPELYVSLGLIKTTNLGAFEQYLPKSSSSGSSSSKSSGGSIGGNFSPSNNPHDLKIAFPRGIGAIGQVGIEQSIDFGLFKSKIRYGFLAFFDATSVSAAAPSGWGIFSDPINAVASNQIDALGAILGLQMFEGKDKDYEHHLYAEAGILRCQTTSKLTAQSATLDVNITEYDYFNTPLLALNYSLNPNSFDNKLGLSFDIMAFPSPYIWNAGLSMAIKKIF